MRIVEFSTFVPVEKAMGKLTELDVPHILFQSRNGQWNMSKHFGHKVSFCRALIKARPCVYHQKKCYVCGEIISYEEETCMDCVNDAFGFEDEEEFDIEIDEITFHQPLR
jgi:hypothetical protein